MNAGFSFNGKVLHTAIISIGSSNGEVISFSYRRGFFAALSGVNRVPLPPCVATRLGSGRHCRAICDRRLNSTTTPATKLRFAARLVSEVGTGNMGVTCIALRIKLNAFEPIGISSIAGRGVRDRRCRIPRRATGLVGRAGGGNKQIVTINAASYEALRDITTVCKRVGPYRKFASVFVCPKFRFGILSKLVAGFRLPRDALVVLMSTFTKCSFVVGTCGRTMGRGCEFFSFNSTVFVS